MSIFARRAFILATTLLVARGVQLSAQTDPFAGVTPATSTNEQPEERPQAWFHRFTHSNFGFRREIMSQFVVDDAGNAASRQSVGFEVLKKFSSETATLASFNFQGRMVRRDGFVPVRNDMEGQARPGWAFEYHNAYVDLYNVFNPFLRNARKARNAGRFNVRFGRFYVPFGLNTQTDTHGTVLQLSNDRNFGYERDWYAGLRGSLNKHLNYDASYMVGSGYALRYQGQHGLAALRLSLAGQYSSRFGLEGGVSFLKGDRLAAAHAGGHIRPVDTQRTGVDVRYRRPVPTGLLSFTNELSAGKDAVYNVNSFLHEAEYLRASRRWGLATQYRRFHQERAVPDASLIAEVSWYFRNDVGNSNLHWLKLDVERRLNLRPHTVIALQYYFYR